SPASRRRAIQLRRSRWASLMRGPRAAVLLALRLVRQEMSPMLRLAGVRKGLVMTYAYVQVLPGFSAERYEQVVRTLGPGPYEGLLAHLAGPCADGGRIIQVWRDADDYARLERSRLGDALAAPR